MAEVKYAAVLERLERGEVDHGYLFVGDNYYQRFLLTEKILASKLPRGQRAYNKHELAGAKAGADTLQDALCSVPLLGGDTVVVVTEINRVPAKSQELLAGLLKQLDRSVTFVGSAKKLDGRTKFAKGLSSVCTVVKLKELSNQVLPGYIRSRFLARSLSVEEKGIVEICRVVGRDCGDIENEVEKIAILYSGRSSLTFQDISDYLSRRRSFSRYEVADYLGRRRLAMALGSLQRVLTGGGLEARNLPWAVNQQLERLLFYKHYADKMSAQDLAGRLRMHPFFIEELGRQSQLWELEQLVEAIQVVHQAGVEERFSGESREQIWERAFVKILAK